MVLLMWAYQWLFGDDRNEPVQVQALKDNQGNHGGFFVLVCRVRCTLWVCQTDGGVGTSISLKARHWSIIQPGNRDGIYVVKCISVLLMQYIFFMRILRVTLAHIPDNDVILIYMGSKVAPMKDPSVAHNHTSPAAAFSLQ